MSELERLRGLVGASTRLWAGADGPTLEATRWSALSGAATIEYNVALCHGASEGRDLARTLEEVAAVGAPAIVMLAGAALGEAQALVRAGWACVGSTPLMRREIEAGADASGVRLLQAAELPLAHTLVQEAFGVSADNASVALPAAALSHEGQMLWGLFEEGELCAGAALVQVEDAVIAWSVATSPQMRGRGCARRLLEAAFAGAARDGATHALVYATAAGERLYREIGFEQLERWQQWSRPRWMLPPL